MQGPLFERNMNVIAARMVEPVSRADQIAVFAAGAGNGCLPDSRSTPELISLEKTLNKIKHRHRTNLNFRIDGEKHIFVICPNKPDGIVEFEVLQFCELCRGTASAL